MASAPSDAPRPVSAKIVVSGGSSIVFNNDAAAAGVAVWNRLTTRTFRFPSIGERLACTISGSASSSRRRLLPAGSRTCTSAWP